MIRYSYILQETATMRPPYSHFPHPTSRKYNPRSLSLVWPDRSYSTTAHVKEYLKSYMMPRAKDSEVDLLLNYYPNDQRAGSPFNTGIKNVLSTVSQTSTRDRSLILGCLLLGPQFKRISAIQGDFVFHSPRRLMLKYRASKQPSWAFGTYLIGVRVGSQ